MKKIIFILVLIGGLFPVLKASAQAKNYGAKITESGAISMGDLMKQLDSATEVQAKVEGKVSDVCQAKGCWMKLETGNGNTMRVTFKDYAFFVPMDIAGKTVIVQGTASFSTTSVEELRHYAEDAKKSNEEIAAITEPEKEMVFEAEGVIVK